MSVNGWVLGLSVALVVVAVVVVLLVSLIILASRTAEKAEAILAALDDARANTLALWDFDTTNQTATRIVVAATAAREYLATKGAPR